MERILIIEDDELIADLERDYLEANGYETELALDGNEGERKARSNPYDAILLDVMLPGKSGFDIFAEFTAIFNPDTILMVYFNYDSVLLVDFNVYQKILFAVQPFTDQPLYFFFVYHTVKAVTKRRRLTSPLHPFQCKNTLFHTNIQEKNVFLYIIRCKIAQLSAEPAH